MSAWDEPQFVKVLLSGSNERETCLQSMRRGIENGLIGLTAAQQEQAQDAARWRKFVEFLNAPSMDPLACVVTFAGGTCSPSELVRWLDEEIAKEVSNG